MEEIEHSPRRAFGPKTPRMVRRYPGSSTFFLPRLPVFTAINKEDSGKIGAAGAKVRGVGG
jgi:hypothetical protein